MLTAEAELWAEVSGENVGFSLVNGEEGGDEGDSWLPTQEMIIIVTGIVGLIVLCCIGKACYNWCFPGKKNSVTDTDLELAKIQGKINYLTEIQSMQADDDISSTVRTESNLVS